MDGDQTTIFDLGLEHVPRERIVKSPKLRLVSKTGVQLVLAKGYDGLVQDEDGLVSRVIHPHSKKKSFKIRRFADLVGTAMRDHWPGKLWWVEWHGGPGQLFEDETGLYLPGSPIEALRIRHPFSGYLFVEADPLCADALRKRTGTYPNVHVLEGDANSADVHDAIRSIIPTGALTVMYADPEDLDDFDFQTVRFFTERYPHVDWLVNFPVMGAVRCLAAGREERAVPLFDHPHPAQLLEECRGRTYGPDVRLAYQRKFEALGYTCAHEMIFLERANAPLYDILFATRDTTGRALDFFYKASGIKASGQRTLFDLSVG